MAALETVQYEESEVAAAQPYLQLVSVQLTPAPLRSGRPLAERRAARARMMQRRRRSLVALALMMGLGVLAWPGHAFGGTTGAGLPTDLANSSVLASGMDYVVQPGDTVTSIAQLMNPVDPSRARVALVHELQSSVVVTGEHILIP
ncbi:MAG TPA: hypothetical protein VMV96_02430 [Acidimicrobiales bacterium]|nr:hypothetical protein [Acidimicrobiales bacterium]